MMTKYAVVKLDRKSDKSKLLEVVESENLKEVRVMAVRKYTDIVLDSRNTALWVGRLSSANKFNLVNKQGEY